jgi:hypothetical protein
MLSCEMSLAHPLCLMKGMENALPYLVHFSVPPPPPTPTNTHTQWSVLLQEVHTWKKSFKRKFKNQNVQINYLADVLAGLAY